MKIYPDTKVYILCPPNIHSGGPELLHQLGATLIQFGVDAYMLYHDSEDFNVGDPVDDLYKDYRVPYKYTLVDDESNILIVYENAPQYLYGVENIRRVLWWLSVDNYLTAWRGMVDAVADALTGNALRFPLPQMFCFQQNDSDIEHWVQSEYARQFVKLNGIADDKIHYVSDYLNSVFTDAKIDLSRKENLVAYNPAKGFEFTKILMSVAPSINWQPVENMTPAQVQALLAKCKVYIDFGNHPGKDRIPREAAICGCVVITNRRGAAANAVDVNIPAEFKFDDANFDPAQIIDKINEIFNNFEIEYGKQENYRRKIVAEKSKFIADVANVFGK